MANNALFASAIARASGAVAEGQQSIVRDPLRRLREIMELFFFSRLGNVEFTRQFPPTTVVYSPVSAVAAKFDN